ncbi:GNAT family N-acetyltransferase [Clostridium cellulovorans]|uniref:GCN5-related N-acetyltransferase n=1 Tax=Clostridium cellulovorans (strain ATCC 35296 / DSM 3052 / OCM 3 / 743B) TaxID=573061 RepID=D9STD8_CLOC7|nr:N-acetyltransferase [Clostridium cellulovorans]ADL50754.1 GCN5-related N-acetyltransferase [Clostridium cellulovorans 743B]
MEVTIIKGNIEYINECEKALLNSKLGEVHFQEEGFARKILEDGVAREEIYIAIDSNQKCRGFIWIIIDGIFHSAPYLQLIAVDQESRGTGIGKKLLQFFEDLCFKNYNKLFLVVGEFNVDAKRLYESIGYIEVGAIPGLYKEGITEHLMMKLRE